jgi:hypothetical protein
MKRSEIVALYHNHPDLFARALAIEDSFRDGPHYRGGSVNGSVGVRTTEGLGRNWSWRAFYESGFETRTERQRRLRIETQHRRFNDVFLRNERAR